MMLCVKLFVAFILLAGEPLQAVQMATQHLVGMSAAIVVLNAIKSMQ